ncbi:MAG TPA: choice-of-anchor X domain-containing protein [Kofleriaceae bacterium]|jgi:hypothetical protein|nr:choice-of-anchor X domain-containing protein [Kofleriaceae bacterium]
MATLHIPDRPFASELITGLALPDGIFEIAFGELVINAHVENAGSTTVTTASVYIESVSDPGIVVVPATPLITDLPPGGARLLRWRVDVTRATPGKQQLSFVLIDSSGNRTHVLKDIFVTRTTFDARSNTVAMQTPEGVLRVGFPRLVRPVDDVRCGPGGGRGSRSGGGVGGGGGTGLGGGGGGPCGCGPGCGCRSGGGSGCGCKCTAGAPRRPLTAFRPETDLLSGVLEAALDGQIQLCPSWYLPQAIACVWEPTLPYAGAHGEPPFEDRGWTAVLCVVAVALVLASSVVAGGPTVGSGDPVKTGPAGHGQRSCGLIAGGAGSSHLVAGLVAAAAACVTATGLGDPGDPFRLGQDHTRPGPGELTIAESLYTELTFPVPVVPGKPFAVGARWRYTRITTAREYHHAANDVHHNAHVLSRYEITAPKVNHAYEDEAWIVQARFWDARGKRMTGAELFVQCFLIGPCGQLIRVVLQDDGVAPDAAPGDGTYTALRRFTYEAEGLWKYLVIAQDVHTARPGTPEQAARITGGIVGGIVRTHQLTISFGGGSCRLIPDGYVHVIGALT